MTTTVSELSNPTLWATLDAKHEDEHPQKGWVVEENVHYRIMWIADGSKIFIEYENSELYDSRSVSGSGEASYSKLDNG